MYITLFFPTPGVHMHVVPMHALDTHVDFKAHIHTPWSALVAKLFVTIYHLRTHPLAHIWGYTGPTLVHTVYIKPYHLWHTLCCIVKAYTNSLYRLFFLLLKV